MSKVRKIAEQLHIAKIRKGFFYLRTTGIRGLVKKMHEKIDGPRKYTRWFLAQKADEETIKEQSATHFDFEPKISILVPTYNTPIELFHEMVDSVIAQSYQNWELCLADGSMDNKELRDEIANYALQDSRIIYKYLEANYGISGNTNGALEIATGDFIGLLDHDDVLEPDCLYRVVEKLQDREVDSVYTDEDKVNSDLSEYREPNHKPDFSPDLLRSCNYITHFFVVRATIMRDIGGFRSEFDGSQDYDLILRCTEKSRKVAHVARILYHWRMCEGSTAENPANKMYCFDAGKRAIQAHLDRVGINGHVELQEGFWGYYRVIYDRVNLPLEVHVVDKKNKTEKVVWVNKEKSGEIRDDDENNEEYVMFLDSCLHSCLENDPDNLKAINEMLSVCARQDVGLVGAKLLYKNGLVRHAGIELDEAGKTCLMFNGIADEFMGEQGRAISFGNYPAVSADCFVTSKKLFDEYKVFDEFGDDIEQGIDFCKWLSYKGKMIVYNPFSKWSYEKNK